MSVEYTENGIVVDGVEISLSEITDRVNRIRIDSKDLCLLELTWQSHRNFDGIQQTRVMKKANAIKFIEAFEGYTVYFGEIAGKHSDIYGTLDKEDMKIYTQGELVQEFLARCPEGDEYNHSFIDYIYAQLSSRKDGELVDCQGNDAPMHREDLKDLLKVN